MTQKTIGPDFAQALAAAGLAGLPMSWSADGTLTYDPSMKTAQVSAVEAVLAAYTPAVTRAQATLSTYANRKLQAVSNSGLTVDVGTSSSPVNVLADTTADGKSNLTTILQLYSMGVLTGAYTWNQTGGSLSLTQAELQVVLSAILTFTAQAYSVWQTVANDISAGTITTTAQIDAAAWPTA